MDSLYTKTGISSFALRGLAISKSSFQKQIAYLKKNYEIISLKQYLGRKKNNESLKGVAVITFDDGFKDFKEVALEILEKNKCPATVFVIGKNEHRNFWRSELYAILDLSKKREHKFITAAGLPINISLIDGKHKYESLLLLLEYMDKISDENRKVALLKLKKELDVYEDDILGNLFLGKEDLKILVEAGIEIGAHSLSHKDLTLLKEEELKKEIDESIDYIKSIKGSNEIYFSVPFAKINNKVSDYLKSTNLSCVLICQGRLNRKDEDIFKLKRLFIHNGNLAQFAYQVCGAQMFFNRVIR
ncbi:MAG: polysaccharide deacetylase family protein [Candidatus Omnitrophota bacterium]